MVRAALLAGGVLLSTVNQTEIAGKLVGAGDATEGEVERRLALLGQTLEVVPFDALQSRLAAYWYARRHPYRLSLGDCACLALAEARGVPVLTAERAWASLPDLPVEVRAIR